MTSVLPVRLGYKQKTPLMWGFRTHFLSNRLNKSARPKIPINTLSLLKPFVIDKNIAIPTDNAPIKLQGFNPLNSSIHLIFYFIILILRLKSKCLLN